MSERVEPIRLLGDPVLSRPCAPVERFDAALRDLVATMFASMYAADGVGLAANQIGVGLRVFVYDCPDESMERRRGVLVNPSLELPPAAERSLDTAYEGCLSVPGARAELARPDRVIAQGRDVSGAPVTVVGTGMLARCLQHEADHLDGVLYIERLSAAARRAALRGPRRDAR